MSDKSEFEKELSNLINRHSMENGCNTPDFILAEYMKVCLENFNKATVARDNWYGVHLEPGKKHFKSVVTGTDGG